ncbi:MAG: DUF3999 domain-containing protein [Synergistaceae bacterium]|nr:DUF3999 domain-containing protein [Synergistaceae bacterium]
MLCLALALSGGRVDAEPSGASLNDFVHVRELKTTLDGALYRLSIPQFVYEGLVQSQKRDLAVFNANAELVPFAVRAVPPTDDAVRQPELPVPFYELPPDAKMGDQPGSPSQIGPIDVYVETGPGGRIIAVAGGSKSTEPHDRRYLLDFSAIAAPVGEAGAHDLRLSLPENVTGLSARLSAFESENLRDWRPILKDAPLIRLRNESARLASDRVALPHAPGRYLLLRVEGTDASFALKEVRYSATLRRSAVREDSAFFEGTAVAGAVEYDLSGAFPVSRVNFVLQEPGLYRIRYLSRSGRGSAWVPRGRTELSMVRSPSSVLSNPDVSVGLCEDRYWRIEFETAFSGSPPGMKITWRTCELLFLAQGKAPFILAFGSSGKELSLQNASLLRNGYGDMLEAEIGPPSGAVSARGRESAPPERGVLWQRGLVWGLLVLGGLLLSAMAWKLMKTES